MNLTSQLDSIVNHAIIGFQFEAIRYSMGTLGIFFLIWVILAPLLKSRKIRVHRSPVKQIKMELLYSLRTIFVFVTLDIIVFDFAQAGVFKQYQDISEYGIAWFLFSIAFMVVLHDTYFYWAHRAMHHTKLYKRFHLTHHRSHNPTPFTAYSFAIGEAVVMYAFIPTMLLIIPLHESALASVLLIMIFKNAIGHCGYELFPKNTLSHPILKHLTTVTHHDMHHEKASGNFGFYFTWWDKWMGTEHVDYEERFNQVTAKNDQSPKSILQVH